MSTKAEDTQKNILDTAKNHFLKDGLTGASLRNIVKDAGLTTGAFYKYYPTKEALFDALTEPYMEHIYQIYDQIVEEFEKLSASDLYCAICSSGSVVPSYSFMVGIWNQIGRAHV